VSNIYGRLAECIISAVILVQKQPELVAVQHPHSCLSMIAVEWSAESLSLPLTAHVSGVIMMFFSLQHQQGSV